MLSSIQNVKKSVTKCRIIRLSVWNFMKEYRRENLTFFAPSVGFRRFRRLAPSRGSRLACKMVRKGAFINHSPARKRSRSLMPVAGRDCRELRDDSFETRLKTSFLERNENKFTRLLNDRSALRFITSLLRFAERAIINYLLKHA